MQNSPQIPANSTRSEMIGHMVMQNPDVMGYLGGFWDDMQTGIILIQICNETPNILYINCYAKKLIDYPEPASQEDWGPYHDNLQSLIASRQTSYQMHLTGKGIVGRSLTGILHHGTSQNDQIYMIELHESHDSKLGEASHELRRPLSNIKTLVDTLYLWGAGEDPQARPRFLGQLHEQVDRLVNTINELLNLSRMQAGANTIHPQQIALHVMIEETIELLNEQAEKAEVSLKCEVPYDYILVADIEKIRHVIQNLIENGIRYNKPGGSVTIKAGERDNSFVIIDTGMGISSENQKKVFERFQRISKEIPGTGLGLAIVKTIVDIHGGTIELKSEEGVGSQFTINIPRSDIILPPL